MFLNRNGRNCATYKEFRVFHENNLRFVIVFNVKNYPVVIVRVQRRRKGFEYKNNTSNENNKRMFCFF